MNCYKVAVLLSSYNGEKYISDQIESVMNQKNVDTVLYIRDDGSSDHTPELIKDYAEKYGSVIQYEIAENVGVTNSFFKLLEKVEDADFFAFCDQDDVWDEDKLAIAVSELQKNISIPAMYFCKTLPVDSNLNPLSNDNQTSDFQHVFNIHEVMTRNNVIGCTLVINRELRDAIIGRIPQRLTMHDHWIYEVCLAIDGSVVYDMVPHIKYRQHETNVVGNKKGFRSKVLHSSFARKNTRIRSEMAKILIDEYGERISNDNKSIITRYAYYNQNLKSKIDLIKKESQYTRNNKKRIAFIVEVLAGIY